MNDRETVFDVVFSERTRADEICARSRVEARVKAVHRTKQRSR